ncbi:hypothetical protein AVEN_110302-1, partial [Araneus ventricosus]
TIVHPAFVSKILENKTLALCCLLHKRTVLPCLKTLKISPKSCAVSETCTQLIPLQPEKIRLKPPVAPPETYPSLMSPGLENKISKPRVASRNCTQPLSSCVIQYTEAPVLPPEIAPPALSPQNLEK